MTLQEIVDDLKYYGFKSEAGTLESCEAFQELEKIAGEGNENPAHDKYVTDTETVIFSKEVTPRRP